MGGRQRLLRWITGTLEDQLLAMRTDMLLGTFESNLRAAATDQLTATSVGVKTVAAMFPSTHGTCDGVDLEAVIDS